MSWFRSHLPALAVAAGAAVALAGSVAFFDVIPRMPPTFDTRIVAADEPIQVDGLQLTSIDMTERDSEGRLPDGAVLYVFEVDFVPSETDNEPTCIAVRLIETQGSQRTFEPFEDWDIARARGDYPASCIASYDGAPGTVMIQFVVPDDHSDLALILGGPYEDRVQVSVAE